MTRPPRGDALNAVDDAPVRSRLRHRQGPAGLHSLQWRVEIGRIYETRGGPDNLRWFWSMPGPMTRSNGVTTLESKPISEELGCLEGMGE